ncbi:MAG: hypothetical protein IT330_14005 [Anaerolineae bacterium]|nr:hypothetical protein [Anaerolineae bacterium]
MSDWIVQINLLFVQVLIGAGLSLLFTAAGVVAALWYADLGKPQIKIKLASTLEGDDSLNRRVKFVHLQAVNAARRYPFVPRQTAHSCSGAITFMTQDYQLVGKVMPIRWSSAPEPLQTVVIDNRPVDIFDSRFVYLSGLTDLVPTDVTESVSQSFAVAIRIQGDIDAYGFTTMSYHPDYQSRHTDYRLPPGNYIVRVTISIGGDAWPPVDFLLENSGGFETFNLIELNSQHKDSRGPILPDVVLRWLDKVFVRH